MSFQLQCFLLEMMLRSKEDVSILHRPDRPLRQILITEPPALTMTRTK